jgi:glycopeptide antibiotics resistance protein
MRRKVLGILCACVLFGILTAGLWPFHAPKNEVSWSGGGGLHFGDHGLVLSLNALNSAALKDGTYCSIELWVQPDFSDIGGTILAFYTPENRTVPFSVHQSIDDLFLRRATGYANSRTKAKFYVEHVFRENKQLFVTITSSAHGTTVYVDGVFVRASPRFVLSSQDLAGQLVIGNYPLVDNGWQGQLKGLAIYNREFTAAEILHHYGVWTTNQQAEIRNEAPVALYWFNEGTGNIVHNQMGSGADLRIPERYFVLHAPFLRRPWDEFDPSWSYCKNILINIGGFIPLGFFFCAYLSSVRRLDRAVVATVVLGGLVSFTIEVLQAFLPTRDSGMTDLITNTLGTAIGAMVYGCDLVRSLFAKVGLGEAVYPDGHSGCR